MENKWYLIYGRGSNYMGNMFGRLHHSHLGNQRKRSGNGNGRYHLRHSGVKQIH